MVNFDTRRITLKQFLEERFYPWLVVSMTISTMVICFMFTLADHASQPPVHSAVNAVRSPPSIQQFNTIDQSRAAQASRKGPGSDLLYVVAR